ncbi:hypothetical protein EB796_010008 [Bugula neritina]|uniref:HMG box domain-containing protein n=1 Tax=Bugula neritina TaxID=10212 RepID=A0A7J7K187_BUGNE|nr:hypothetical protein EB796_010008 [Bugula neritina]
MGRNSEKDPNRPKRAQSAYFIFMGDFREKCKRTGEADTSNVTEFTKLASTKWKALNEEDRKPWDERAALDKQRYEREMESYHPPPGMGGGKARRKKDPYAPKRPKSGYLHYLEAFRAKHPELGHKEIVSKGAEEWGRLTDEQKVPYNKLYETAKEEYNAKMQAMVSKDH